MVKTMITRRRALATSLAAGAVGGLSVKGMAIAGTGRAGPLTPIRLFSFPGSLNLLIWAGREKGFFASEGLEMTHEFTRTSMELATKLVEGQYDIATSSIDNVIAYNSGQGQVPLSRPADFFGFMNISRNMTLPLIVQGDIKNFADLKGKTLAVDAVSTGFSFVLRKILETHGLGMGDYELVSVGNARDRLASLKAGEHAGAILTPSFNRMAMAAGLRQIGSSADFTDNYQGTCFISSRRWSAEHPEKLNSFIRAVLATESWLAKPDSHVEAADILRHYTDGMSKEAALNTVKRLVGGLSPDFNLAGIETVLALRQQYGAGEGPLGRPSDFIDTSYLDAVRGGQK
ncbi:ABC transporter substrate-binding protein [Emcibacter sp.]|uniref:ABC transporter substrate-binding protein n=1 Tax=Emcibacter sp. TaxID=1979954 RepID=UPI003A926DF6